MMSISVSHKDLNILPDLVKTFLFGEPQADFLEISGTLDNIERQIQLKSSFDQSKRNVLVQELENQYTFIPESERSRSKVWQNIQLLRNNNTYTLTTGQQIHVFLGPMYVPHKILSVIANCQKLKQDFPEYHFVPIFWMATEDHDFEEIRSVKLWNREFFWNENHGGATGELSCKSILSVISEIKEAFTLKSEEAEILTVFENAYSVSATLAEATTKLVHHFWGEQGIVCLDANRASFKEIFKPYILKEITEGLAFDAVKSRSERIKSKGYETQIGARDTSLFLFSEDGKRERIDRLDNGTFRLFPSEKVYDKERLKNLAETKPVCFSPNVALRPLYQETILPNLAYIGGAGEVLYWFQLKEIFEKADIPFPVLLLRKMAVYIGQKLLDNWRDAGFAEKELLFAPKDFENLLKERIVGGAGHLKVEAELEDLIQKIGDVSFAIDPQSVKAIKAEGKEWKRTLHNHFATLQEKILEQNEAKIKKVNKIRDVIYPSGMLQERSFSFLEYLFKQLSVVDNHSVNFVDNTVVDVLT